MAECIIHAIHRREWGVGLSFPYMVNDYLRLAFALIGPSTPIALSIFVHGTMSTLGHPCSVHSRSRRGLFWVRQCSGRKKLTQEFVTVLGVTGS
jgi:hypothetical protein